ncbi:MAG: hypothetical protein M1834_005976 [Cirrosporium novae-zelandiae]|nr:MAG: hypothetical protein M1834_005976 [Cirrosporium novae-zelandiae]
MTLSSRLKKAFRRSTTSLSKSKSAKSTKTSNGDFPHPKYSRRFDQACANKLKEFSLADAWGRRPSTTSLYSPFGSRVPSRRNSLRSVGRKSRERGRRSLVREKMEGDEGDVAYVGMSRVHTHEGTTQPSTRSHTATTRAKSENRAKPINIEIMPRTNEATTQPESAKNNTPFSEDELTKALTKSTLKSPEPSASTTTAAP